jgi:hypothetical protein
MNRLLPRCVQIAAMYALWLGVEGEVRAGALSPVEFASLGAFPTLAGTYTLSGSGMNPTLTGPGGTVITGVYSTGGIAVFDFDAITVNGGQQFTFIKGAPGFPFFDIPPLALLSRGDVTVDGGITLSTITVSGTGVTASGGGPGGGNGGLG